MEKNWFASTVDEAYSASATSSAGLNADEAEKRLAEYGPNELKGEKKKSLFVRFFEQFKDVMVIVLLCAAAVTAIIAIVEKSYDEFIDVGIILAIVIINAVIGVVQESKAEQALEALKNMSKPFAKVRRGGEILKVESAKLVPGDIVILEAGDVVPADLRLTESRSLKIEESALTGESVPSEKEATFVCAPDAGIGDRHNMAFSTSVVTYGRGEGIVVGTGMNTEMGKIADMLAESGDELTPIQKKLNKTGKFISIAVIAIAAVIFVVSVLSTIHRKAQSPGRPNSRISGVSGAVSRSMRWNSRRICWRMFSDRIITNISGSSLACATAQPCMTEANEASPASRWASSRVPVKSSGRMRFRIQAVSRAIASLSVAIPQAERLPDLRWTIDSTIRLWAMRVITAMIVTLR